MLGKLVGPDIVEMIAERQFAALRKALTALLPQSVAEIFADMSPQDVAVVFRLLPRHFAADVFEYMPFEAQEPLLRNLGREHVAAVLNEMAPDDRTTLLEDLPDAVTQRLLSLLSPEEGRIATELLAYPADSIGRRMTPDYIAVRPDWTAARVLDHIRRVGHDKETLNVIYVIDERGHLIDDVRLREVVLADPAMPLSNLMDRRFVALRAEQDQEEAVHAFQEHDRIALPVVDSAGTLIGIVTVDDVMDVAEEEVTEDIQKMAAVTALDAPYLEVNLAQMIRKRATWLSILFVGEMLTASVMVYFETSIARAVVLALFIPLIISSGGNSGSQTASIIIRALALNEIRMRDWLRVFARELASGLALGCILGLLALVRILFWPWRLEVYGQHYALIAMTVALALVGVVALGTTVGAMFPILLQRLGFDPAISSTPFVATLVDVAGIVIYFILAGLILHGVLL